LTARGRDPRAHLAQSGVESRVVDPQLDQPGVGEFEELPARRDTIRGGVEMLKARASDRDRPAPGGRAVGEEGIRRLEVDLVAQVPEAVEQYTSQSDRIGPEESAVVRRTGVLMR
jgi:hypothetical protein